MAFDTIIRGGTVATASDTFACEVAIKLPALVEDGYTSFKVFMKV